MPDPVIPSPYDGPRPNRPLSAVGRGAAPSAAALRSVPGSNTSVQGVVPVGGQDRAHGPRRLDLGLAASVRVALADRPC
jgi:hypothetical protein